MIPLLVLAEVAKINPATPVVAAPDDLCSFVPMEAVDESTAAISSVLARPYREIAKGYTVFAENDVLLAKITPCMENGKCAIARGLRNGVGFGTTEFHVVRASKEILPEWIHYFWRLPRTRLVAERYMTGSAGQKRVPRSFLQELQLPVPALAKQRMQVKRLNAADALRRTRRYALQLCDEALPAAFVELFGDPIRNPRGWEVVQLEEIASVDRGKFSPRPRNDPTYYGGRFPFIQTGDISNSSGGYLNEWTQTLNDRGRSVSRSFPAGTIVIAIVGATIGMTAVLEVEVYCPDSVVGIQINPHLATREYIHHILKFWRPVFLAQAPETARANINLDTLRPLRIPLPPLALQQYFTELTQKRQRLRATHVEALRQSDHLFQTLLHDAFAS